MARKRSKLVTAELGFDLPASRYAVDPAEVAKVVGLGPDPAAMYFVCLKPFALGSGRVKSASWYRFRELLRVRRVGPGRRPHSPTYKELRTALRTLIDAGLAVIYSNAENERRGVLEIFLVHGVGGSASDSIRAGYRAGSRRAQTRADA